MILKRELTIHLTGGLGNQLFQFAAGLSLQPDLLKIEPLLGRPRLNSSGIPEIYSFSHPQLVQPNDKETRPNRFVAKIAGFILRNGVNPKKYEEWLPIKKLLILVASAVFSFRQRKKVSILQGIGVGYTPLVLPDCSSYLVGYFQCHTFVEGVKDSIKMITISSPGQELIALRKLEHSERPLIVHYRYGDYLIEQDFGIPSHGYYEKAIEQLWEQGDFGKIWVFSDNIPLAQKNFPSQYVANVRWVNEVDNSAAATLEAMRLGHGYVIANSTFSWWGAYLSHTESPKVVAPSPWFARLDSPKDLTPGHWLKFPS
jgi:hypothetical protein